MIDSRLDEIIDCLYRVATKALIVRDGKLLLVKEKNGYFGFPGGGVDFGEDPFASLARELREEIGLNVPLANIDCTPQVIAYGLLDQIPRVNIFYKVETASDPIEKELAFRWTDKTEFLQMDLSPTSKSARVEIASKIWSEK